MLACALLALVAAPLGETMILRGPHDQTTATVEARKSSRGRLHLLWRASALVDEQQSSLTVLWDDQPLQTVRVAERRLSLRLPFAQRGYHRLEIRTHLVMPQDPCLLENPDAGWLRIEAGSKVTWPKRVRPSQDPQNRLALWPAIWRGRDAGRIALAMEPESPPPLAAIQAILELLIFLRRNGLDVVAVQEKKPETPTVKLRIVSPTEYATTGGEAQAVATLTDHAITLTATSAERLLDGVRSLANSTVRTLCPSVCRLGPAPPAASQRPATQDSTVLTLADVGLRDGIVIRSMSAQRVRFTYAVPPTWRLRRWPELRLLVRASETSLLDRQRSQLKVSLNDQPLGTWDLQGLGHDIRQIGVKIPGYLWHQPTWTFEVSGSLSPSDVDRCAELSVDSLWLALQPNSYLTIPREEPKVHSIASFYQQDRHVSVELGITFNEATAIQIAELLIPLKRRFSVVPRCEGPCMSISPISRTVHGVVATHDQRWRDDRGTLRIPVVRRQGAMLAIVEETRLAAYLTGDNARLPELDLSKLGGPRAIIHDAKWHSEPGQIEGWEIVRRSGDRPAAGQHAPLSKASRRRLGIDITWLLAAMTLMGLLGLWTASGLRRQRPRTQRNTLGQAERLQ